jgi:hypothetical protein
MGKRLGFILALVVGAFLFFAHSLTFSGEATGGKEMTITGRVVDPACYIQMGLKGESHKQCAAACAKAGQAYGILDEKAGVLYQVLEGSPGTNPNKLLEGHEEDIVTVKGMVFAKNNINAIVPIDVKTGQPTSAN